MVNVVLVESKSSVVIDLIISQTEPAIVWEEVVRIVIDVAQVTAAGRSWALF